MCAPLCCFDVKLVKVVRFENCPLWIARVRLTGWPNCIYQAMFANEPSEKDVLNLWRQDIDEKCFSLVVNNKQKVSDGDQKDRSRIRVG